MTEHQILAMAIVVVGFGTLALSHLASSPTRSDLARIESKLDKLHKQQMIFVDAVTRLVKALEKILEKEDE